MLQHVDVEGPGTLAPLAAGRGLELRVLRPDRGQPLPRAEDLGGLVVMGGPMGVGEVDRHPWLADERRLVAEAVGRGLPVLGVCLGAQQLAAALGAEVRTLPAPEVGVGRVVLTSGGRRDRVFGPEYGGLAGGEVPCVHWHADTFDLPPGAVHLAATAACPHQAFRVGDRAYGLQFHVEVDAALAEAWRPELPDGVALPADEVQAVETVGRRLLSRFLD
ncbi:MAG: gamma-glutamyl-gamma-aminobutyrate hydrolase family protein, partial [Acidimicrobiales bacterium]|nr:gamma-glutamyl-gamma-aminobutyrate hydrolase family protein [Acidimicrobiales bacterium]